MTETVPIWLRLFHGALGAFGGFFFGVQILALALIYFTVKMDLFLNRDLIHNTRYCCSC